jgi:hypothetical protein
MGHHHSVRLIPPLGTEPSGLWLLISRNSPCTDVLDSWALRELLRLLPGELYDKLKDIQVDPKHGGKHDNGRFLYLDLATGEPIWDIKPSNRLRINREKFRKLLLDGIDVQWHKCIKSFETTPNGVKVTFTDFTTGKQGLSSPYPVSVKFNASFEHLETAEIFKIDTGVPQSVWILHEQAMLTLNFAEEGCILIGADGANSKVRRLLCPETGSLNQLLFEFLGATVKLGVEAIKPLRSIDPLLFQYVPFCRCSHSCLGALFLNSPICPY